MFPGDGQRHPRRAGEAGRPAPQHAQPSALKPEKQTADRPRNPAKIYGRPLANRLGIGRLKWKLEDLAFRCWSPSRTREIKEEVGQPKRSDRKNRLRSTVRPMLKDRLTAAGRPPLAR